MKKHSVLLLLCLPCILYGASMTEQEKKDTGYNTLSKKQQQALNAWISKNCEDSKPSSTTTAPIEGLSLSLNTEGGRVLILSDNSKWEVDPKDLSTSTLWITPFPLEITSNGSDEYPYTLMNLNSNEKVKAKKIS